MDSVFKGRKNKGLVRILTLFYADSRQFGKSLIEKPGIIAGIKILVLNKPDNYFELTGKNLNGQLCTNNDVAELIHLFVMNSKEFETEMKKLNFIIKKNPKIIIWVSWYKKSAIKLTG